MRRDMHRWFIASVGVVLLAGFLAFSASQNPRLAIILLQALHVILLVWVIYTIHRRRAFKKLARSNDLRSRETRCRGSRHNGQRVVAMR